VTVTRRTASHRVKTGNTSATDGQRTDEPFTSADARTEAALHPELLSIWQETQIPFVTHGVGEIVYLSD
jgi:ABC-type nitrate/sulfonate/bicarbonate transport system ATPase subunit